jgi:hypothetical protein
MYLLYLIESPHSFLPIGSNMMLVNSLFAMRFQEQSPHLKQNVPHLRIFLFRDLFLDVVEDHLNQR